MLATAPDADILQETVCLLTQRMRAGRATFLIKVKVRQHRGEPINERTDTLAEVGRQISDDNKRWDDRTDRMSFEVQKGNTTVRSVWTNSVRNAAATPSQGKRGGLNCNNVIFLGFQYHCCAVLDHESVCRFRVAPE
jgi:hypothetical protein